MDWGVSSNKATPVIAIRHLSRPQSEIHLYILKVSIQDRALP
jgi:hypothetical protein